MGPVFQGGETAAGNAAAVAAACLLAALVRQCRHEGTLPKKRAYKGSGGPCCACCCLLITWLCVAAAMGSYAAWAGYSQIVLVLYSFIRISNDNIYYVNISC